MMVLDSHGLASPNQTSDGPGESNHATAHRVAELAAELSRHLQTASSEIATLNDETRFVSINAQIEAARAGGQVGAAFGVVAQAIQVLSSKTAGVARTLATRTGVALEELVRISQLLSDETIGSQMVSLASHTIDVIDRNLYERSCDCRWWASDESLITAFATKSEQDFDRASRRLGVILDSYSVYLDLVACDTTGKIVAQGRPGKYASLGLSASQTQWFRSAMRCKSGDTYGFESAHVSHLVGSHRILAYAGAIREHGLNTGSVIGVLGALFNWDALGQHLADNQPNNAYTTDMRCSIIERNGRILADSDRQHIGDILAVPNRDVFLSKPTGFVRQDFNGRECYIAQAASQGFETYRTGWHTVLIRPVNP